MTPPRLFARAAALAGAGTVACSVGILAAPAASADPTPTPTGYVKSVQCVSEGAPLPPVTAGVSNGQRELRWAALNGLSAGEGVTVAVIDSGVNPGPAFGSRLTGGGDDIDPAHGANGLVDCDGHGTVVAGLIAAAPDTATGFAGVAPGARILSIRQSSSRYEPVDRSRGAKTAGDLPSLARAIGSAVTQGAKVINISAAACLHGISEDPSKTTKAVADAFAKDVVVVAAAGNVGEGACSPQNPETGEEVTRALPASAPGAVAVGAVTTDDKPAEYSLRGDYVTLAAPGDHLVSVNPHIKGHGQVDRLVTPDGVSVIQGTSFSAPIVSGVVALVRARYPHLTAKQVVHRLTVTAAHPAGPHERNRSVGYGVIDPRMALTAVLPEEGAAGTASTAARPTALAAPPADHEDPTPRLVALGGTGLLALTVVAFAVVHLGRRPR